VLQNRCSYLRKVLSETPQEGQRARTRLGRYGQFEWTVDADSLVRVVSNVLLEEQESANWIGRICNYDIHEVLELCKQIVLSPHVKADELLKAQVSGKPIRSRRVLKSIIAPKKEQFQGHSTDVVTNIFGFWADQEWAPLLPARVLALLRAREDDDRNRKERFPGFVSVDWLEHLLRTQLGTPARVVEGAVARLRTVKLVESYDSSTHDLQAPGARIKITPRGRLHLDWALDEATYVRLMGEVDPIVDSSAHHRLRNMRQSFFDAMRTGGAARAEETFVAEYVAYVLYHAGDVARVPDEPAFAAVRAFELELRARWKP
jgi:hypothetical protein